MRILLDSCIPTILSKQLNHSVVHGNDIFPPGTTDDVIYAYAKKHKYILVTSNYKDFENTGKFPLKKHPGSIVFNVKNPTKFKYLLDILFIFFSKKSDFSQKRILVKQTKIEIKHRNGKVSELKINDLKTKDKKHKNLLLKNLQNKLQ